MKVFNTFSRSLEELKLDKEVRMYVCGITTYDYSHIGHARSSIFFDTVRRYLEYKGYTVNLVQNFTDVDDKIVNRAVKENSTQKEISSRYIKEYLEDMARLNVKEVNHPRVSDHIQDIIEAVKTLVKGGYAYEVDGDVYFHVPKFERYGELSKMDVKELDRHRIEPDPRKKDSKDFALWKSAKEEDYKAKSAFDSPWGKGRPGWHIECSVLATKYLGSPFDIHGGGKDLIFPHHENERTQSYALYGIEPVRYWIHNDFVTVGGEKMSKSLGNIIKIRDVIDEYGGEVVRYFLISSHYRTSVNYDENALESAKNSYLSLKNTLELLDMEIAALNSFGSGLSSESSGEGGVAQILRIDEMIKEFETAMDDDFNIPKALSVLHDFSNKANKIVGGTKGLALAELEQVFLTFLKLCNILGLFDMYERIPVLEENAVKLVKEREQARKNRDFTRADKIRDELKEEGIILIDTPRGTRWIRRS